MMRRNISFRVCNLSSYTSPMYPHEQQQMSVKPGRGSCRRFLQHLLQYRVTYRWQWGAVLLLGLSDSWSGHCAVEKYFLFLPAIEARLLGSTSHSLVVPWTGPVRVILWAQCKLP